jgi:PAS domain S-box-containing protein
MNNANFYSLFEFSPVPMWVFDTHTLKFLEVNKAAVVNYGYSKEEFLSMTIDDISPKEERIKNIAVHHNNTKKYFGQVFHHIRKNGELIFVEIESNPIIFKEHQARIVLATDATAKLKAQEDLLRSEQRFKALVQDGSDMITIIDKNFHYKYVSPASLRVFGAEPSFFVGQDSFQYIHPDDLSRVREEAKQIWSKKKIQLSPYRYKDVKGDWLWIETFAANLLDDPAVEGIVCTSKDVTQKILSDKMINENIERYNIVSKATSDVIWDWDFESNMITWNKAIKGILKYPNMHQTTYKWWEDHIHPADREKVIENLDKHIAQRIEKWESEYRFLCGNGEYKYIYDRGFLLLNTSKRPLRMIGAMQDISKRKEEEQWSKLLESVVINTSDGVLITDASPYPGPYIVYVNAAMLKMSGYEESELIGKSPNSLYGQDSDPAVLNSLAKAIANECEITLEFKNYRKDGAPFDVSATISPIADSKGQLSNWISIQRDVTKQKEYLDAIKEQNARLKNIRWLQSHGVRAPLARIMSLVELISTCENDEERSKLINFLKISADELDRIIIEIANDTPRDV